MKAILMTSGLLTLFCGCGPKLKQCDVTRPQSSHAFFVFVGYSPADVDTIILRDFGTDTSFITLSNTDTVFLTTPTISADTIFSGDREPVASLFSGKAYEIILPSVGRRHRLWAIDYDPVAAAPRFEMLEECPKGSFILHPATAKSDGPIGNYHDHFGRLVICVLK